MTTPNSPPPSDEARLFRLRRLLPGADRRSHWTQEDVEFVFRLLDTARAEIATLKEQNSSYFWSEQWTAVKKELEFVSAEMAGLRRVCDEQEAEIATLKEQLAEAVKDRQDHDRYYEGVTDELEAELARLRSAAPTRDGDRICPLSGKECYHPSCSSGCRRVLTRDGDLRAENERLSTMTGIPILDDAISRLMKMDQESALALADIAIERARQIESEGWTPAHDDNHPQGQLATAAAAYALAWHTPKGSIHPPPDFWPWEAEWWKPRSKHRNCVRAGALLVAELARHYRSGSKALASPQPDAGSWLDRQLDAASEAIASWSPEKRAALKAQVAQPDAGARGEDEPDERFDAWIEELDENIIQREFGYERGEFTVYPSMWRNLYEEGLTPRQAWQRAMDANRYARIEQECLQGINYARIKYEDAKIAPSPSPEAGARGEEFCKFSHQSINGLDQCHRHECWAARKCVHRLVPSPSPEAAPPNAEDVAQWLLQGGNQYTAARILQRVDNYDNGDERCSFVAMAIDAVHQAGERAGREQMREEAAQVANNVYNNIPHGRTLTEVHHNACSCIRDAIRACRLAPGPKEKP